MATFTWTISQLERKTADGFITIAHWNCNGVDKASGAVTLHVYDFPHISFLPMHLLVLLNRQFWLTPLAMPLSAVEPV